MKQRIVRYVGAALNDRELKALKDLAEVIKVEMEQDVQPGLFSPQEVAEKAIISRNTKEDEESLRVDLKKLREEQRITLGIHEVYGKLYHQLGFEDVPGKSQMMEKSRNNLKHIVLARNASPLSKRATVKELSDHFGVDISLSSVYRTMDHLDDKIIDRIKDTALYSAQQLFGINLRVLFYDCTTLYFESFKEDELKNNGYSKDLKFNQPQVLLALLVTEAGIPVGYEVFPGCTFEGHTLQTAIERVESKYNIRDMVIVADSAMLGKDNLKWLEDHGKRYIVGARLKSLSKSQQSKILNSDNYREYNGDIYNSIADLPHGDKCRLIVSYSEKRAKKDRDDRETALEKLTGKLKKSRNPLSFGGSYGYKRFLKTASEAVVEIDEKKVNEAAMWDGLHGVITNIKDMTAEQIREHYHGLWQVEESFRITKHDLKIRPVYHWTPKRIKAHIAICFMSLTLARHLMYRTKLQYHSMSAEEIRRNLSSVQLSILKDVNTNKRYGVPSAITPEAAKLYKIMAINWDSVPFEIKSN
ncbi:MAG TPA: IS1634 family transposase [bacterium]|nr:IS1634 family transposase [bacterium]